jgi:hypothetical protein
VIISKDPKEILEYLEINVGLISVTADINIFVNIDLSLIEYYEETPGMKLFGRGSIKERVVLSIPGYQALSMESGIKNYLKELMDPNQIRFISLDNFLINSKQRLIATKDFRVILKDHKGNIPEEIMLNISTVCYMMIGGLVDYQVAAAYVKQRMRQYGVPYLEFKTAGYITIDLYGDKNDLKYKGTLNMPKGSQ